MSKIIVSPLVGTVIWLTGISGAGKSTVGQLLVQELRHNHAGVIYLDGDILRQIFGETSAHDSESRQRLAHSYGRLCHELSRQGAIVVCATISMFHQVRDWNRTHIERYFEVYLRVPLDQVMQRDSKGFYARALKGEIAGLVGFDQSMQEPISPDLIVDNFGSVTSLDAVQKIISALDHREA